MKSERLEDEMDSKFSENFKFRKASGDSPKKLLNVPIPGNIGNIAIIFI